MNTWDTATEMKIDMKFEDWLVYRSGGGIWVAIGTVGPLNVSGHVRVNAADNHKWSRRARQMREA
ncbi:MAG: hypothetical protein WKF75_03755 [Singulisphaera sp.]